MSPMGKRLILFDHAGRSRRSRIRSRLPNPYVIDLAGAVQAVQAVHAVFSPTSREIMNTHIYFYYYPLDHLDHLDQPSNSKGCSGPTPVQAV